MEMAWEEKENPKSKRGHKCSAVRGWPFTWETKRGVEVK
jgi:hypothetical protein